MRARANTPKGGPGCPDWYGTCGRQVTPRHPTQYKSVGGTMPAAPRAKNAPFHPAAPPCRTVRSGVPPTASSEVSRPLMIPRSTLTLWTECCSRLPPPPTRRTGISMPFRQTFTPLLPTSPRSRCNTSTPPRPPRQPLRPRPPSQVLTYLLTPFLCLRTLLPRLLALFLCPPPLLLLRYIPRALRRSRILCSLRLISRLLVARRRTTELFFNRKSILFRPIPPFQILLSWLLSDRPNLQIQFALRQALALVHARAHRLLCVLIVPNIFLQMAPISVDMSKPVVDSDQSLFQIPLLSPRLAPPSLRTTYSTTRINASNTSANSTTNCHSNNCSSNYNTNIFNSSKNSNPHSRAPTQMALLPMPPCPKHYPCRNIKSMTCKTPLDVTLISFLSCADSKQALIPSM